MSEVVYTGTNEPEKQEACELYEYPPSVMKSMISCKREINRLADWIMTNIPHEIGKETSESAVDVAIRLLEQQRAESV